jgi:hypothetical protein
MKLSFHHQALETHIYLKADCLFAIATYLDWHELCLFSQTHPSAHLSFSMRNTLWAALYNHYFSVPSPPMTECKNIPSIVEPDTPPPEIYHQASFFRHYGSYQKTFQENPHNLHTAPIALKNDEHTILRAITNGYALQYASIALKRDAHFMLKAVKYNGLVIR